VREELRALCQSGTKSTARGEKNPAGGGRQHAFKGGLRDAAEGAGEVGQRVEEERGRERGGRRGRKRLGRPASALGRLALAAGRARCRRAWLTGGTGRPWGPATQCALFNSV
jgi:hypothetical protein